MPNALPKEIQAGAKSARFMQLSVERAAVDEEARTVELAFSSETPVERYWGVEVLDHSPASIRMDRLTNGGPLLMDHNSRDQVGVIESVQIGGDRKARAVVRFGKGARASEVFQDVIDGIRRNVSVGYVIHDAVLESERDGVSTYRVRDWEPYEVSLVSVPADTAVGVGREAHTAPAIAEREPRIEPQERVMPDPTPATSAEDITRATAAAADTERKRVAEILGISDAYRKYNLGDLAAQACREGWSTDQFKSAAIERMGNAPKPTAEIGLTDKEVRKFSFVRAINALANPNDLRAREAAAFEFECSRAVQEKNNRSGNGISIPAEILRRDLTVGTPGNGGYLVQTTVAANSFIDILRNAMVINRLGVQMLTGLVGNIAIPRLTGAATAYWVTEGNGPTESTHTIDQVPLTPKTVGAFTDISRRLLLQSSLDVEAMVQRDLATVVGLAIQSVAIQGGGSNQPTGILETNGIGDVVGGVNGAAPDWQDIIDLETDVAVANADIGSLAYLTNAKVRGKLKATPKVSGQNGFIWDAGTTPLNGYGVGVTNAVPSNLTKGSAAGLCSAIIFGNFADLIIGMWGGLDLLVDPYTGGLGGTVRLRVLQDVDVAIRHAESFSAMQDALTA